MALIFFLFGLIIGSFLNVVVYRLRAVESLWGRSHCPKCRKKVRWHDNVPLLSFMLLSAKCRDCGEKISWVYPIIEFSTGVVFALAGHYFFALENTSTYLPTLFYLVVFSLLIVIFAYDAKFMEIPMIVFWIAAGLSVAYLLLVDLSFFGQSGRLISTDLFSGISAGILAFLLFFFLAYFSQETWMGYGDAYIGLLAGLLVGLEGILWSLILSFTTGALFGTVMIMTRKKTMKSQVPFAPFLVLGIFLTIFLPRIFPELAFFLSYF